jgi:hypothetical protein
MNCRRYHDHHCILWLVNIRVIVVKCLDGNTRRNWFYSFTVRMGLFTGLREEELYYIHDKEICCNELACNLHPINMDRNTGIQ